MAITFLTMRNKNLFLFTMHILKNINLNILLAKNKNKKTLLTYNKSLSKKWSWTYNLWHDHFRCYSSAYSEGFYWPCGLRNMFLITAISPCDRDQTVNKTYQQTFFRKRISMLRGLKVSSLAWKCIFYRPELTGKWGPHATKVLRIWNAKMKYINTLMRVDEKNRVIHLLMLNPRIMVIKCHKWLILCTFCWIQQNISPSLGKIFKCMWKALFDPYRNCYGSFSSELQLAKYQCLKIQDSGILLLTHQFFWYLSTISHEQLSPKPINHTIFCKNSIISSMCT